MIDNKNFRELLSKRPFKRILPQETELSQIFYSGNEPQYSAGINRYEVVTQADFLAEYQPTGHKILSTLYFPDIYRTVEEPVTDAFGNDSYDEEGNLITQTRTYVERVPRYCFPFQQIIALTHIYHATSNDVQHELSLNDPTDKQSKLFDDMCSDWISKGMEEAWYESYKSREITGDTAFVGCMDDNYNFSYQVLSFNKGDIIYPHYDKNGKLSVLARLTKQYDGDGNNIVDIVEVWDDRYYSVYKQNGDDEKTIVDKIKEKFGISGYSLTFQAPHGFSRIPVEYMRNEDGPGWSAVQNSIECYELTFSQMAHNNQAFGESILVLRSDSEIPPNIIRGMNGTVKEIDLGKEDEAKFLEGQSASESYMKQLEINEEMIYRGASIIKSPTELKSGDTPATSIKLLFTPNMQKATADLSECRPFLTGMWNIFAEAYGKKNKCLIDAMSLPVISWGKVYIPQSESSIVSDTVALVNSSIISHQTAAERVPFYSKPGETNRITKEQKVKQDMDLLYEVEMIKENKKASVNKTGDAVEDTNNQTQKNNEE